MKKNLFFVLFTALFLATSTLLGAKATIRTADKTLSKTDVIKIESARYDGTSKKEGSYINVAQGTNEFMLPMKKIKSIELKTPGEISCYEDSSFSPIRTFCTKRNRYEVTLRKPTKSKAPVEVVDDQAFLFTVSGEKDPIKTFFYKIKVSNQGNEGKTSQKQLVEQIEKIEKRAIIKINFL